MKRFNKYNLQQVAYGSDFYKPLPEHDWNPLKSYPRNESCWCGSGIKSKKCCLNKTPLSIKTEHVEKLKDSVNLIRAIHKKNER